MVLQNKTMVRQLQLASLMGIAVGLIWSARTMAQISSADLQFLQSQDVPMLAKASVLANQCATPLTETALTADTITEIETYLDAYNQTGRLSGNILINPGSDSAVTCSYGLANHEHNVANTPETKFRIGSITKQFTAVAILQLQEQGLLDIQAPISSYLPNYPDGDRITSHHLLTHTSGIPEYLDGEVFPDIQEWLRLSSTLEQLVDRFQDLPLEFTPGEQFKYSNSGYVLLTQILETVSGQTYADYVQTNIFTPLGMQNTGYEIPYAVIPNLAQGYTLANVDVYLQAEPIDMSLPQGAGGLYSTLEDLAIWNQWLYGDRQPQAVLTQPSIDLLTQAVVKMDTSEDQPEAFYGYGLIKDSHLDRQRIHHNGGINGFRSSLMYYPKENLTISVLLNLTNQAPEAIAEGLAAIVLGEPYTIPQQREAISLDPALYERYVGTYQLLPELQLNLLVENNQLISQAPGQEPVVLYPFSETEFFVQIADIVIKFSVSEDGTVEGLTLVESGYELFAPKLDQ